VDQERARREIPFVAVDGRVSYGSSAIAAALATGSRPARMLAWLLLTRLGEAVGRRVYRVVAVNRHKLPGSTAACTLPTPESKP
jgi:predicted DCC family thiol-disulfide oxidoreductase YuxK